MPANNLGASLICDPVGLSEVIGGIVSTQIHEKAGAGADLVESGALDSIGASSWLKLSRRLVVKRNLSPASQPELK